MSQAVTVSIRRTVAPGHIDEVTRWVQAGVNLANKFPGFLGSGWIRQSSDGDDWQMLYRFADEASLEQWERSTQRGQWLVVGRELVVSETHRRLSGIEGWFDEQPLAVEPVAPPRWKQAVSIFLGFAPTNIVFTLLTAHFVPGWNEIPLGWRTLLSVSILTPVMVYVVLPFVTARLRNWLSR